MKTITRKNSRFRPSFNFNNDLNYMYDSSITNLIKRVEDHCLRYGYDYEEPIYKVIETETGNIMTNTSARLKSNKTRYKGNETTCVTYYEAKLRKVELA